MDLYDFFPIEASGGHQFAGALIVERVAWANRDEVCKKCIEPTHRRRLAPFTISWEEGSDVIPDFLLPSIGRDFIVTERVKQALEKAGLTGYTAWPAKIKEPVKLKKRPRWPRVPSPYSGPPLWDIYVDPSELVEVVPEGSNVEFRGVCSACGRDRYRVTGAAGEQFFIVNRKSWNGNDFMRPDKVNSLFITPRAARVIQDGGFTNIKVRRIGRMID